MTHLTKHKWAVILALLSVLLAATAAISLAVGPQPVAWPAVFDGDTAAHAIIFVSRLPRILLAAVVGMALASSGASYQALLKNPLADPFILGVAGGAALASVAALGLGAPFVFVSLAAFAGAAGAMLVIFLFARTRNRLPVHTLLLTGVVFNAFCFALILFVNSVVRMEQAYQILFMLIGNLEVVDMTTVAVTAALVIAGFVILCMQADRLNLLTLGDDQAVMLGVDVERVRRVVFFATSLMVGAAVAVAGLIGFVGLFVPHAVRMLVGADQRLVIPASGLAGAAFLVAADTAARTVLMNTAAPTQLPVGVITALIGAPAFVWLMRRSAREGG